MTPAQRNEPFYLPELAQRPGMSEVNRKKNKNKERVHLITALGRNSVHSCRPRLCIEIAWVDEIK